MDTELNVLNIITLLYTIAWRNKLQQLFFYNQNQPNNYFFYYQTNQNANIKDNIKATRIHVMTVDESVIT